ncbi:MAG: hypothetical protein ABI766_09740 [Gemmatimonadales bacterium]
MTDRRTGERGMALALAIFALVVVGALVAAAFVAGHIEQRTGRGTLYAAQAADAAEAGAAQTIADWGALGLNSLAPGATAALPQVTVAGRSAFKPAVTRLNDQLFLVQSLGTRGNAGGGTLARRTVAIVARLASLGGGPEAALTVAAPVDVGSQVVISGTDSLSMRGGALDCAPGHERPALLKVGASSTAFAMFGEVSFDELKAHAGIVLPDTTLNSAPHPTVAATRQTCDGADPSNWGEPRRSAMSVEACKRYFPIVYARGPRLTIAAGGRGQGVLLVEGDLDISGDFDFTGLIVSRGGIRMSGSRTRVTGAIMAAGADGRNVVAGTTTIQYSSCALKEALSGAAFAEPLGQRSWVQVY